MGNDLVLPSVRLSLSSSGWLASFTTPKIAYDPATLCLSGRRRSPPRPGSSLGSLIMIRARPTTLGSRLVGGEAGGARELSDRRLGSRGSPRAWRFLAASDLVLAPLTNDREGRTLDPRRTEMNLLLKSLSFHRRPPAAAFLVWGI